VALAGNGVIRGGAAPALRESPNDFDDARGVPAADVRLAAPVGPAVVVGERRDVHPVGGAGAARAGVLVGADVDERVRVPVVRRLEHDRVAAPGVRARQPERQLVRLARRVEEVAHLERRRERGREPRRVLDARPSGVVGEEDQADTARPELGDRLDRSGHRRRADPDDPVEVDDQTLVHAE
jgi:hypothetical protein